MPGYAGQSAYGNENYANPNMAGSGSMMSSSLNAGSRKKRPVRRFRAVRRNAGIWSFYISDRRPRRFLRPEPGKPRFGVWQPERTRLDAAVISQTSIIELTAGCRRTPPGSLKRNQEVIRMQPYSQKPQQGMSLQQMPLSTQEPNRNWGDFSSQAAMPQNPAGDDNLHQALERAGAGNFAQQLQQIAQQLQFF